MRILLRSIIVCAALLSANPVLTEEMASSQRILELGQRLTELEGQISKKAAEVARLKGAAKEVEARLVLVESELRDTVQRQDALAEESRGTETLLKDSLARLREHLRWLAIRKNNSTLLSLTAQAHDSDVSALSTRFLVERLFEFERARVERIRELSARLRVQNEQLSAGAAQLSSLNGQTLVQRAELSKLQLSMTQELKLLQGSRGELKRQISLLKGSLEERMQGASAEIGDQVVSPRSADALPPQMVYPIKAPLVETYSSGRGRTSEGFLSRGGLEFEPEVSQPVVAAAVGTVAELTRIPGSGWVLILEHKNGLFSLYAGLESVQVDRGQEVGQGQELGHSLSADEGNFYFEVRKSGKVIDPRTLF